MSSQGNGSTQTIKRSLLTSFRHIGPGIFAAMTLLGAGELVDVAVSGANYGYALLWGFALVLLSKFFFMFMMTKYQLVNPEGWTIMRGFGQLGRVFPLATGGGIALGIYAYGSFYVPASGVALARLVGAQSSWASFAGAALTVVTAFILLRAKNAYRVFEGIGRVVVLALVLVFLVTAISEAPALRDLISGLLFQMPENQGAYHSVMVVVALVGVAGVTPAAIVYNYAIREKGWTTPSHRAVQVLDLIVAIVAIALIDFSVWVVAAEVAHGRGMQIDGIDDLARMMELAVGPVGPPILWLGIFFASYTSVIGTVYLFSRVVADAVHNTSASARMSSDEPDFDRDPIVRWLATSGLAVPLLFATPWAPDVVVLAIVAVTVPLVATPFMLIGTLWLTASRRFVPTESIRTWQSCLLIVLILLAMVSLVGVAHSLVSMVGGLW